MNAKNETPYIHEEPNSEPWIKSRSAKLTGIIAGGVLALGAAFGAGVAIGSDFGPRGELGIAGFDRHDDRDRHGDDRQRPPHPGERDENHGEFQLPEPTNPPATQNG
jgi:hypothetical protein